MAREKQEGETRTQIVAIRVRPSELETLRAIAEDEGRTVSNAVRHLLREAMKSRDAVEARA